MISPALTQRYDRLQELATAKDLLSSIEESGLNAEKEKQFLSEKIQDLQKQLDDTAADAQRIIDQLPDSQAQIYASIHYQIGYEWIDIADMFHITADAAKSRVYRYLRQLSL